MSKTESMREELPARLITPHWYAVHIRSRHEKKVADQLAGKNVSFFLPLYKAQHRWKDRIAKVELPLFPGYLFVQIPLMEKMRVLEVPGVVQLVSAGSAPVPLVDNEIEILSKGLSDRLKAEPHPYLKVGNRVRIKSGPLTGLEGILLRHKDDFRVVISVDLIMKSMSVEIAMADLETI